MTIHVKLVRMDSGYWELHDKRGNCVAMGSTAYEVVQAYTEEQKKLDAPMDILVTMTPDMEKPMRGIKALLNIPALIIKAEERL